MAKPRNIEGGRPGWGTVARRIRVPLGFVFALLYAWLARPTWLSLGLGLAIAVAGLLVRALASGHVRKNEELTVTGPYAYTRNPLYLGSLMLAIGFGIASRSPWVAFIIVVLFLAIYLPVIRSEEAFLRERFPQFEPYAQRVPRLVPRLGARVNRQGSFSWELYRKHREYNAILGSAGIVVVLIVKLLLAK